ncbi:MULTISPECIES: hypothetical protein [unclassified Anabaena]|uniref:hypothetical protein n=1 Tax=unclassified Anabaena TaxID=2619674 RepID=UPI0008344893|nr:MULTISPECIES: hypothetical protein [unclassified Anabaena]
MGVDVARGRETARLNKGNRLIYPHLIVEQLGDKTVHAIAFWLSWRYRKVITGLWAVATYNAIHPVK